MALGVFFQKGEVSIMSVSPFKKKGATLFETRRIVSLFVFFLDTAGLGRHTANT